jgi:hypothetical protein
MEAGIAVGVLVAVSFRVGLARSVAFGVGVRVETALAREAVVVALNAGAGVLLAESGVLLPGWEDAPQAAMLKDNTTHNRVWMRMTETVRTVELSWARRCMWLTLQMDVENAPKNQKVQPGLFPVELPTFYNSFL